MLEIGEIAPLTDQWTDAIHRTMSSRRRHTMDDQLVMWRAGAVLPEPIGPR